MLKKTYSANEEKTIFESRIGLELEQYLGNTAQSHQKQRGQTEVYQN